MADVRDHQRALRRRHSSVCMERGEWMPECNDGLNLLIVVAGAIFVRVCLRCFGGSSHCDHI